MEPADSGSDTAPALVLLAAGRGTRFGGPKQLATLGPRGETILDFSIYDARRAGFGRAVLVVRRDVRDVFERTIAGRWRQHLPVELVDQDDDSLSLGVARSAARQKPWGTGHAVLSVAGVVDTPFVAANADDFYGADAFRSLGAILRDPPAGPLPTFASLGFPLRDTLTDAGGVNRAVLRASRDGWLEEIEEIKAIDRDGRDGRYRTAAGESRRIAGETPVSTNIWGFTPAIFDMLESEFRDFVVEHGNREDTEFELPTVVNAVVRRGGARVRVLRGVGPWCGVTYPEDVAFVAATLRDLVDRGAYPRCLWA
ncbi:MAG TPA: NTP transferase domain-containing protein [Gemmatimonadaceae bacterium]|nr:NTP transferase domain-containing protein [Gemmatimonadaceae bacterium]